MWFVDRHVCVKAFGFLGRSMVETHKSGVPAHGPCLHSYTLSRPRVHPPTDRPTQHPPTNISTQTPAKQEMTAETAAFLKGLRGKITLGVVGGSDFPKQKEQLGETGAWIACVRVSFFCFWVGG